MEKVSDNLLLFSRNLQANGAQFFWDTLYIAVFNVKRWDHRSQQALVVSSNPCHLSSSVEYGLGASKAGSFCLP